MRQLTLRSLFLFLLAGLAAGLSTVRAQDIQVIHPTNTVWIYNDSSISTDNPTIAAGTSWRDPAYVPVIGTGVNQWKTGGRGLFGNDTSTVYTNLFGTFGNGFRTPLDRNIGGAAARVTFYFITKFDWPYTPTSVVLRGTNWLDDGGVVYLNGVEVFRARQPGTPGVVPAWTDLAGNQGSEGVPEPLEYSAISLVTGENTLAVEVHQSSAGSSDLAFTTALRAVIPAPPTNTTPTEPSDRSVLQNRPTTMTIVGDGQPRPTYQWYQDDVAIPGATANSYTIALMQSTNAGLYKVVLNNEFGSATSRVATVSYEPDMVPPKVLRAVGSATFTNVIVEFDELMDKESVEDPFNWDISGFGYPAAATLNPDGRSVTLATVLPQTEGALYTVTANAVKDLAGNEIVGDNAAEFRAWVTTSCGGLVMDAFRPLSTSDNNLNNTLLADPNFPDNPAESLSLPAFDTRTVYPDDSHEGYGGRIHGLFIPPYSGNWIFYLASDDSSRLFLNPTGPAASGKVLIQEETGCCNIWTTHASAPQPLLAGQGYYIEAIYKEGGGGDYCKVAARLQADGPPGDNPSGQQTVSAFAIPGSQLGVSAVPMNVVGPVVVVQQPASQSVEEHALTVTFSVGAANANGATLCYQWQRSDSNGPFTDIPGATRSSVSISFPTIANDNGDKYRCIVLVPGAGTTSAEATLTVTADVTRPRLVCALATSATSVVLYFDEPLDPSSMDPFNFAVDQGVSVADVVQNATNPLRVDMTTSPMTLGSAYQVTAYGPATAPGGGGVVDAGDNAINPDPSTARVIAQIYTGNPDGLKTLPTTGCLPLGCLTDRGFNGRIYQLSTAIANDNTTAELILTGASGPNIAPLASRSFMETGVINYNIDAPTGGSLGHIMPDAQFPGYPPAGTVGQSYENMVMEALCYVELKAGIHRWIVNSDDGFRVYAGLTPSDPIIGEFNGGRGSTDTAFDFIVKEDCLYPFRLLWEQGGGGANVEWQKEDLNNPGTFIAINGDNSIKAYKMPVYRLAIQIVPPAGNVEISWTPCNGLLEEANEVTGPWTAVTNSTSPYVVPATRAQQFYRVRSTHDEGFAEMAAGITAKVNAGQLPPRIFTEAELNQLAAQSSRTDLTLRQMQEHLERFYSITSAQLGAYLERARTEAVNDLVRRGQDPSELQGQLQQIAAACDQIIAQCESNYHQPFHIAALKGLEGVDAIGTAAFAAAGLPGQLAPAANCQQISYPFLYQMGAGVPRFAWNVSANLRRQSSTDGCWNYHHSTFQNNISRLIPLSPLTTLTVGSHGLNWRLYGQSRALYYRGWICTAFGRTPYHLMVTMPTRKQ